MTSPTVTQADEELFAALHRISQVWPGHASAEQMKQEIARHRTAHSGEGREPTMTHDAALDAICGTVGVVTLSYQEAIEGYLDLRGLGCIYKETTDGSHPRLHALTDDSPHVTRGRSNGSGEDAVLQGLAGQVAEAMEDDRGFWRSCTGCHETNEGYSTGAFPYSNALKCELGTGCHECGGLGARWDDTDYADMADFIRAADRDHENVKRILIENGIQAYPADQIAMAITELDVPARLRSDGAGTVIDDMKAVRDVCISEGTGHVDFVRYIEEWVSRLATLTAPPTSEPVDAKQADTLHRAHIASLDSLTVPTSEERLPADDEQLREAARAVVAEAANMTMTMRRRKVFDGLRAALSNEGEG